jgi:hypothetical protein
VGMYNLARDISETESLAESNATYDAGMHEGPAEMAPSGAESE